MKTLTPQAAKTLPELLKLRRDNVDFSTWWALVDENTITVCQQKTGEAATGKVKMSKREFDRMLRWYVNGMWR